MVTHVEASLANEKDHSSDTGNGLITVAYLHGVDVAAAMSQALHVMVVQDSVGEQRIGNVLWRFSGANVCNGRNEIVKSFLDETEDEWLLTLDSDVFFEANLHLALLASADPVERPVMCGLYFGSDGGKLHPHIYTTVDVPDAPSGVELTRLDGMYPKGVMEVSATGAGCMLIHRSVLVAMREARFDGAFPFYAETDYLNGRVTGEDITFCLRASQLGVRVFVDTRILLGHLKPLMLTEELYVQTRIMQEFDKVPGGSKRMLQLLAELKSDLVDQESA